MESSRTPDRRRLATALLAAALLVAACGSGDGDDAEGVDASTTTSEVAAAEPPDRESSTQNGAVELESIVTSDDGELTLTVESTTAEIWSTTDREVCSPIEPAVAVFEAAVDGDGSSEIEAIRAFFVRAEDDLGTDTDTDDEAGPVAATTSTTMSTGTSVGGSDATDGDRRTRTLDFAVDDDGVWRVVVGPFEASNRNDRPLDVTVVARTVDGDEVETGLDLTLLAPVPCGDGERPGRRSNPDPVTLTVSATPADGVIVGADRDDCAGRPRTLQIRVEAQGAVVAFGADITLPDGSSLSRSADVRGGRRTSFSVGPFPSPPQGSERTASVTVRATDVFGTTETRTVGATLVRPEPCDDDSEPEGPDQSTTTTTVEGDASADVLSLSFDPASPVVAAVGSGLCPSGATTFVVEVVAPEAATSVTIQGRTADGATHGAAGGVTRVSSSAAGSVWRAALGPFPSWRDMPDRSTIGVRATISNGSGSRSVEATATLRRPESCSGSTTTIAPPAATTPTTTTPTTTAPATSAPTTVAPATTAAPATTSAPAAPQITNARANPNPVACEASFNIGVQASGAVTQVGANIGGGIQALSGGGGSWTGSFTAPSTRRQVTVTVRVNGPGGSDQRSFTLNVDC